MIRNPFDLRRVWMVPFALLLALVLALSGCGLLGPASLPSDGDQNSTPAPTPSVATTTAATTMAATLATLNEDGRYTTPQDVAAYLHEYQKLPPNFITKGEAMDLGWESDQGNLWEVTDELSIGGDRFGNREGLLPKKSGRIYYECDVNYEGGFRGAERLVFSNDGLIFYTDDHYQSFTQLY